MTTSNVSKPAGFLVIRAGENFRRGSGISVDDEKRLFSALHEFLLTNDLLHTGFDAPSDWSDYELRSSHLNEEGLAVVQCGLDKWLKAIDRGTSPEKASSLNKCLVKVRSATTI
jgi:hypothetical protein